VSAAVSIFGFLLQFVSELLCLPLPLFRLIGCN